jgi:uncharacterized protein YbjT (DUF2867 family)
VRDVRTADMADREAVAGALRGVAAVHVIPPAWHPHEDLLVATSSPPHKRPG